ncbi:3'-5' exoribonuclease YhaM family protein [Ignavigranum ruoffiae]|uniref:3'-5' exoribonuclease YhaM family protein n=1 Tax=Ignavigranum ruoffiae TaxID=89093 RepID=UPI00205156A8|nr:HD domain-containing protein [Ignavigranum ruoffiae]UPQ85264.1 HD domain-containing protein [Ignavigranum ruoffiae]
MKQLFDLNVGEEFALYVLIKSADVRTARNGNPFIAFRFQDKSGAMDGMYWSANEKEIASFQAGKVVLLQGRRENYQGRPQVRIEKMRLAEAGEPIDPSYYVESIELSRDELVEILDNALFMIKEPNIARVVRKILKTHEEAFFTYPAAKRNHHALAGGLAFHTLTMVQIASKLLEIYPQLNASLLIGGIILHDIGKTIELSGPISTEYTLRGKLMGHIVLMSELIDRTCQEIGIDSEIEPILLLKHVVLAHHGKQEFGSPVLPQLLEAELIHYIDDMDAKINMITQVLEQTDAGHFTPQIFPLDKREIYKPKFR